MNFHGSPIPYQELHIYYIQGPVTRDSEQLLGPDFLGNWREDEYSFLFFSRPSTGLVKKIVDNDEALQLIDEYQFTYEEWQGEKIKPRKVSGFFIVPPWQNDRDCDGEIKLVLDPGVVFGTSSHATTRDCLLALQNLYRHESASKVLDLGTGTGILAIGAARLAAGYVVAVDNNPLAVQTAIRNVGLNGLTQRIYVKEGLAEHFMDNDFDLLIANIHYPVISHLIQHEGFLRKKFFILSGLMRSQSRDIRVRLGQRSVEILHEWNTDMIWHTILGRNKDHG